jgi:ParB/RepB/Spo0J family partition protein
MALIAVSDVQVVDRHRANMGDLDALASSLQEIGQLQPIVVTSGLRLVAGGRRLAAAQRLGWVEIDAKVVDGLSDASALLRAERDENTCRKSFTPTEEHSLYEALLALEAASDESQVSPGSKAKQSVAEIVTGNAGRYKTLDKVGEVKAIADDTNRSERLREKAREALVEMDRTGNITGPYMRVSIAERAAAAADKAGDFDKWSDDERSLLKNLQAGHTVVVSFRENHSNIVRWAQAEGFLEAVDRRTEWGNPFEMPHDGDRESVIRNYADYYLPHKPSLLSRIPELKGKALACWCAPEPCHADVLKAKVDNG